MYIYIYVCVYICIHIHVHTYDAIIAIKKNEMPFAATWMDLEIIILSMSDRERHISYDITFMWNLKENDTNELTETDSQTSKTDLWLPRGRGEWERMDWELGISRCKLLYIGWINNKVLLYDTGYYIQYPVINHNGKEYEKKIYICITESLCCTPEINTTLEINYTSINNKK